MHFVNNASTDGTAAYLSKLTAMGKYHIINCTKNISGAGGFAKGLSQTITYDVDCILFIDDDAMLSPDYMKKLFQARSCYPRYHAYWMKKQVQMFLTGRRRCSGTQVFMV